MPAADAAPAFDDELAALDPGRWERSTHELGRGTFRPENVEVVAGALRLRTTAHGRDGAEVRTRRRLPPGSFAARIRVADVPGSLTSFFLYAPPDHQHEVDIEVFGESSGYALLTTYDAGQQRTVGVDLGFDPTAGYHDYALTTGPRGVAFHVDGVRRGAWVSGVPTAPMHLFLSHRFPSWREPVPRRTAGETAVDRVRYDPGPGLRP